MGCISTKKKTLSTYLDNIQQLKIRPELFVTESQDKFSNEYEITKELGKGAFSKVYQCLDKLTGNTCAVKMITKKELSQEMLTSTNKLQEIQVLKTLDHPNILKVFQIFEDKKYFYIVMEFCAGGELFNKITSKGHFSERETAHIIYQLLSAVTYCHSKNIIHRDLKPENILLEEVNGELTIKVADFGSSVFFSKNKIKGCFGSVYYIAPEVLENSYNELCDEWSCGVILYILLSGKPPFGGKSEAEILHNIKYGIVMTEGPHFSRISEGAKDLIKKLVERDTSKRLTAQEALSHNWLQSYRSLEFPSTEQISNIFSQLSSFNASVKLRSAIFTFITTHLVTQEEKRELQKSFRMLDQNGDGRVSKNELLTIYKEVIGGMDSDAIVDRIMKNVDTDGSGFIDYTEFIQATLNHEILFSKKNLEMAFRVFDKDGSGTITTDELRTMLSGGKMSSNSVWESIIREVDQNGDGEIDLKEFTELVLEKM
ncbi:unnamed protein product [Blepharisma stoltei]|uniref:non-specific serine/threonine protein kinase n=1 Tax=Blepharisma stoltei TaxID=1481888 RepID=A0AAU9JRX0_9CILI|nr:unnamed protein product [Blepharisma stoltei]